MTLHDENVEAVRAAGELLVRKFRGLDGWFRHLQQRDRKRESRAGAALPKRKKPATRGK